jgi:hypothetical protein
MIPRKKHEMKTFDWIIFKNPLEARGLHPPRTHHPRRSKMLTSKAQGKVKTSLTSEKPRGEDESGF